ncbi:MAG: hypothetical protein AB7S48_15455 [Bacteroidales bacterium]
MSIEIVKVETQKDLKQFIYLPSKLHKEHKNWVPPLYFEEWLYYNSKKNKSYRYCDTVQFLAVQDGEPVGRIMGIINKKYNEDHGEETARFCHWESINDISVASKLLNAVEVWAKEHGMKRIIGPMGFSDKDPQGLLIEGFDEPMVISSNCNFAYQVDLMEQMSYCKDVDLVVYKVPVPKELPDFYRRILDRVKRNAKGYRMINIKNRREIKPWIRPVLTLVNETFIDIYGFNQMEPDEMDEFAKRYLAILDPRFIKIIVNSENNVIAFILGIPDISQGIQKSKGHVFPFGFLHILFSARKSRMLSLLLGAIHPSYRNLGFDTWMGAEMLYEAQKAGLTSIDSHLELETNLKMRAEMEKMGGEIYKRYRIFQKSL